MKEIDWKKTLEGSDQLKDVLELSTKIAGRSAGLMAFRRKYYGFWNGIILDEVTRNRSGNFRGIVVSAKWRQFYNKLGKFGAVLNLAGIPMKAAELSWKDLSAEGISANVGVTLGRWGTESTLLGPAQALHAATEVTGWAADRMGYEETARDIKVFAIQLEGSINDAKRAIDRTLSVANARDVLTWDRSVINPENWGLLAEGMQEQISTMAREAQSLHDSVVESFQSWRSRNF